MKTLLWNDSFNTNIESIDTQHKGLVESVAEFILHLDKKDNNDELIVLMQNITKNTLLHIHHEENLLELHNFSNLENHKEEHCNLINDLIEIEKSLIDGTKAINHEVVEFLKGLITNHIDDNDRAYIPLLISNGVK